MVMMDWPVPSQLLTLVLAADVLVEALTTQPDRRKMTGAGRDGAAELLLLLLMDEDETGEEEVPADVELGTRTLEVIGVAEDDDHVLDEGAREEEEDEDEDEDEAGTGRGTEEADEDQLMDDEDD